MTRVLMTADAVGGVWTYALELADALAVYDVDVHLAVMGPPMSKQQRAEVARSAVRSLHECDLRLEWMADAWPDVDRAGEWLLELESRLDVNVVHLNGYAHASLPWRAPTVVVSHSDVVSWWRAVHRTAPPAQWSPYSQRVSSGLRAADVVVAPTRAVLDDLATSFGFHGGVVVPNGRGSDWVVQRPKESLVLGAGRVWDAAKNLQMLERVAPRVPWPVAIAGDAAPPDGMRTQQPSAGARHLGRLDFGRLAEWLARAALFVAPARYEPFGLGPLEAAHAGCALVLGDVPSLREVWEDAAVYVDPGDDDALVSTLTNLCEDRDLIADLGRRARERATRYSPTAMALGYVGIYRRLATRRVPA